MLTSETTRLLFQNQTIYSSRVFTWEGSTIRAPDILLIHEQFFERGKQQFVSLLSFHLFVDPSDDGKPEPGHRKFSLLPPKAGRLRERVCFSTTNTATRRHAHTQSSGHYLQQRGDVIFCLISHGCIMFKPMEIRFKSDTFHVPVAVLLICSLNWFSF